jgi:caffeoyl-CoA O-methyltransferase
MSELIAPRVSEYLESLVPARPPELEVMEAYARQHDFPIIGPVCGHLCYQLARTIGARRVFELGSGFGYSTAFFARAVQENGGGVVHHVVWDDELSARARRHLTTLGYDGVVEYHVGEAVGELRRAEGPFDIAFVDIDKDGYPESLPVVEDKLRMGGLLIIDNMLWSGRIFDPEDRTAATRGVREFTRAITASRRWITSLVPIRDGMIVATKIA